MFTPRILRFESLPSTNLEAAREAGEGAPEGLCIVAAEQTAGRGRLERQWLSPKGAGLYFSIVLRPRFAQSSWPLITLLGAIAVHDTLEEVFPLEADIKWPNDILIDEKKLCGILAETVETELGRAVILGIGINLRTNAFPVELGEMATSVESATGQFAGAEMVIEPLVKSLVNYYQVLHGAGGPEMIIQEWSSRSSYATGKQLCVTNGETTIEGTSRGLERDGALIIETAAGEFKTVRTGDVSRLRPLGTQGSKGQS